MGFGGQVNRNVAITQPGIIPMETLRQTLISLAEEFRPENGSTAFTVQLNNLDPKLTFTEEELTSFLNDIRDSLQLPGFSWLMVGKQGLSQFITKKVPRLRSIISHDVSIAPLSFIQVEDCMKKRIAACALPNRTAKNPITMKLLARIHDASGGSLRETFIVCSKLCMALAGDPIYDEITENDASALLAELLSLRLSGIKNSPLKLAILKELSQTTYLTQKDLARRLNKNQTAISRATKSLIEHNLILHRKEGRVVQYWSTAEIKLAAAHLNLHPASTSEPPLANPTGI
jgi:DNA-binding MarR family transcriptional regulator